MKISEFKCDEYTVTSYGNGTAYFVAHNEKEGFFVQGDDAETLREKTNDFENSRILSEYFAAVEAELLAAFNEQQVIEGDDDLQTNDPENALFRYWLSQRTNVIEVTV